MQGPTFILPTRHGKLVPTTIVAAARRRRHPLIAAILRLVGRAA